MKYCVLYNPKSGGKGRGKDPAKKLLQILPDDELYYRSMPEIKDFKAFLKEVTDDIIVCGGDGTLNYFINKINGIKYQNHLWYYPTGSGNDFHSDVGEDGSRPYSLDKYIANLPTVHVADKDLKVLNGAGAGLDGFSCAEGERLRRAGRKTINYTLIAIQGFLYKFHPHKITLTVDGKVHHYDHVWLSPIMYGKFFGGGVKIAPRQDRHNGKTLTVVVATCPNVLKIMTVFPKIFKGNHEKHTDIVKIFTGQKIKIELDTNAPFQYDGEVIQSVSSYEMWLD